MRGRTYLYAVASLMLAAGVAIGASYVEEDWSSANSGWVTDNGEAVLADGGLSYLGITFTDDSTETANIYDVGGGLSLLSGTENFTAFDDFGGAEVVGVTFDFYVDGDSGGTTDDGPGSLSLYFMGGGNNTAWTYNFYEFGFDSALAEGWHSFGITFDASGWLPANAGGDSFEDSLTSVTRIGIELISRAGTGVENYRLDNFRLYYPEPGTYAVLAFALLSLGVTFRGKLREGLEALKR